MPDETNTLTDVELPVLTKDLIALLAAAYPPRCIAIGEDPIVAHRYAAQVDLVAQLIAWQEDVDADARALRS